MVSPVISRLHLEDHGLRWLRAPLVTANPTPNGPTAVLSQDVEVTAASLDVFSPGDGDGWRRLYDRWLSLDPRLAQALMAPFPPVRPAGALAARLIRSGGPRELLRFARFALLLVRRMAEEHFDGEGGALLLGGNALHADLVPEGSLNGVYGWLLAMLGQQVGFSVPEGGAGRITDALVARLESLGGQLRCGTPVTLIEVRDGRARAVRTAGGETITARRAVIADVDAPDLYLCLVGADHLPASLLDDLGHFEWDTSTVKVDWALRRPIPWAAPECRQAGTVHLADSLNHLSDVAHALATRRVPARPFLIVGQQSMTDPTRMPAGAETAWAYAHVPQDPAATPAMKRSPATGRVGTAYASPTGWSTRSSSAPPASGTGSSPATCTPPLDAGHRRQPGRRRPRRGHHRNCIRNWCSAPSPAWPEPRRRSPVCTSPRRPPIPAAGSTVRAATAPPAPRCSTPDSPDCCPDGHRAPPRAPSGAANDGDPT